MNILTFALNVTWLVPVLWHYIASTNLLQYNAQMEDKSSKDQYIWPLAKYINGNCAFWQTYMFISCKLSVKDLLSGCIKWKCLQERHL